MKNKLCIVIKLFDNEYNNAVEAIVNQIGSSAMVICVYDKSGIVDIAELEEYKQKLDIIIVSTEDIDMSEVDTDYIAFMDQDCILSNTYAEKILNYADKKNTDIIICGYQDTSDPNADSWVRPVTDDVGGNPYSFNYSDYPNCIASLGGRYLFNKVFKKSFLDDCAGCYELLVSGVQQLQSVLMSKAGSVSFIWDKLLEINMEQFRVNNTVSQERLLQVFNELDMVFNHDIICNSVSRYKLEEALSILEFDIDRLPEKEKYDFVKGIIDNIAITSIDWLEKSKYCIDYHIIKNNSFDELKESMSKKIVVSFTTHPKRINEACLMLETLFEQKKQADTIKLYLAREQFDNLEKDLPAKLRAYELEKKLEIIWCDDIKPHKKYFYEMQNNREDIIITVDDDILYSNDMILKLYRTYLAYPHAISTNVAHVMLESKVYGSMPYVSWIKNYDKLILEPSMNLIAIGGGGILYPPACFSREYFNKEAIVETCLFGDDLWLKAMEIMEGIPVVVTSKFSPYAYIDGSQEVALWKQNIDDCGNDRQWDKVKTWFDKKYGNNILIDKMFNYRQGVDLLDCRNLYEILLGSFEEKYGAELSRLENEVKDVRSCHSYRLGHKLLQPLRMIKNLLRGKR